MRIGFKSFISTLMNYISPLSELFDCIGWPSLALLIFVQIKPRDI
jgi:hypothetical protein